MRVSRESRKLARELFRMACPDGELSEQLTEQASSLLVKAKPRGYYGTLHEFTRLIRMELAKNHAIVDSAIPLDPNEQTRIDAALQVQAGKKVTSEFRVKPSLLGGLRIQIGSDVLDGSVLARLEQLKTTI